MVDLYISIRIIGALAPKSIIDKNIVSLTKIISTDFNLEDFVQVRKRYAFSLNIHVANSSKQCLGFFVAGGCSIFMLGSYGAVGDFNNVSEKNFFLAIATLGLCSFGITALWKAVVIRRQMQVKRQQ